MKGTINDLMVLHFTREDYKVSDEAQHSTDTNIFYAMYVNSSGDWYILKRTIAMPRSYRFVAGTGNYVAAWAGKEGWTYERYDEVFGE